MDKTKITPNMCWECDENKYMHINDLNHLRHKTSQLKQG
jgi:hypothetical protein